MGAKQHIWVPSREMIWFFGQPLESVEPLGGVNVGFLNCFFPSVALRLQCWRSSAPCVWFQEVTRKCWTPCGTSRTLPQREPASRLVLVLCSKSVSVCRNGLPSHSVAVTSHQGVLAPSARFAHQSLACLDLIFGQTGPSAASVASQRNPFRQNL